MPRPKGSKNRKNTSAKSDSPIIVQITELESKMKALTEEVESLKTAVEQKKKELREKKALHKKVAGKLTALQSKQAALAEEETERERVAEAEKLVAAALAGGKSTEEIMKLLK